MGNGRDVGVTLTTDAGLTLGVYAGEREAIKSTIDTEAAHYDQFDGTWFAKYSAGPVSIGFQQSYLNAGGTGGGEATTAAKVVRTAGGIFEETQMSIAFNVNDNVSISYTDSEDVYDSQGDVTAGTTNGDVSMDTEMVQISYSMGGMSIKAYQIETTNPTWDSNATAISASEISIGLAF